ncbi:Cytochrome P450 [Amycolatopsis marina]|uniref:Cytochrome P450 n=1 Tax=Amycolatopsis marina TaxID=490629 RepID=A0A1I0WZ01_9PSEU|nr:cytochrome P450 [Amycolatopsis marina]SFA94012.1 Cytochrome P450 [Amycolatopsis marina]
MAQGEGGQIAKSSVADTARLAATVVLPTLATGVIKRRPALLRGAEWLQVDRRPIALFQRLRRKYGDVLLTLPVPGRSIALPLAPDAVGRILHGSPSPFSPASIEKAAALGHFQPHGVLISTGAERAARRSLNESVLQTERPLHELADPVTDVVREEVDELLGDRSTPRELDWDGFNRMWWRVVRRVVLGDGARTDHEVTDVLTVLRRDANWAYLRPRRTRTREHFERLLHRHLDRAEPDSLAAVLASETAETAGTTGTVDGGDAGDQVAHWLFAFDAAGMVTMRALALLATHPDHAERARAELAPRRRGAQQLPFLRACALDTVRLWPTTPLLLRRTTGETRWGTGSLAAGSTVLVYCPYFHRDSAQLHFADRFDPDIWLDGRVDEYPALVPFSAGPAECPGRNLVLFVVSTLLGELLRSHDIAVRAGPELRPDRLPATIDNFSLRCTLTPA